MVKITIRYGKNLISSLNYNTNLTVYNIVMYYRLELNKNVFNLVRKPIRVNHNISTYITSSISVVLYSNTYSFFSAMPGKKPKKYQHLKTYLQDRTRYLLLPTLKILSEKMKNTNIGITPVLQNLCCIKINEFNESTIIIDGQTLKYVCR